MSSNGGQRSAPSRTAPPTGKRFQPAHRGGPVTEGKNGGDGEDARPSLTRSIEKAFHGVRTLAPSTR